MNIYPEEFIDKNEVIEEMFSDLKCGDAMLRRNRRARILRRKGWAVKCEKIDFTDLTRSICYSLTATRKREVKKDGKNI